MVATLAACSATVKPCGAAARASAAARAAVPWVVEVDTAGAVVVEAGGPRQVV
jgi:hypothetical protein